MIVFCATICDVCPHPVENIKVCGKFGSFFVLNVDTFHPELKFWVSHLGKIETSDDHKNHHNDN